MQTARSSPLASGYVLVCVRWVKELHKGLFSDQDASSGTMSFPALPDEEIINFCKEVVDVEIPITPAAPRDPTNESTMTIFRFFVNGMFGWDLDAALVVPFDSMTRVQFFDIHQEQVPEMRCCHFIRSLLKLVH